MRWSEWTGKRSSVSAFDDGRVSAFCAFWRLIMRQQIESRAGAA
jgi:hypothetical protein